VFFCALHSVGGADPSSYMAWQQELYRSEEVCVWLRCLVDFHFLSVIVVSICKWYSQSRDVTIHTILNEFSSSLIC
jgi:hypothetical protein